MCGGAPVLRIIGLVFLVLALLACLLGYLAPFWVRIPLDETLEQDAPVTVAGGSGEHQVDGGHDSSVEPPNVGQVLGGGGADDDGDDYDDDDEDEDGGGMMGAPRTSTASTTIKTTTTTTTVVPGGTGADGESTATSSTAQGIVQSISTILTNGSYWGLWAMCHSNLSCECFAEKDFQMEREFPGTKWHRPLYGLKTCRAHVI